MRLSSAAIVPLGLSLMVAAALPLLGAGCGDDGDSSGQGGASSASTGGMGGIGGMGGVAGMGGTVTLGESQENWSNDGIIRSSATNGTLTVAATSLENFHVMEASGSGELQIRSTTFQNEGSLVAQSGGSLRFDVPNDDIFFEELEPVKH